MLNFDPCIWWCVYLKFWNVYHATGFVRAPDILLVRLGLEPELAANGLGNVTFGLIGRRRLDHYASRTVTVMRLDLFYAGRTAVTYFLVGNCWHPASLRSRHLLRDVIHDITTWLVNSYTVIFLAPTAHGWRWQREKGVWVGVYVCVWTIDEAWASASLLSDQMGDHEWKLVVFLDRTLSPWVRLFTHIISLEYLALGSHWYCQSSSTKRTPHRRLVLNEMEIWFHMVLFYLFYCFIWPAE